MAYIKTIWKARQGLNLNKFSKLNEDEKTVILVNSPDSITQEGTPFSEDNMNHIEQGIFEAHEAIENALVKAKEYVNEHNESDETHKDIREKVSELSDEIKLLTPEGNEELLEELHKLRQEIAENNNVGNILKELQDLRQEITEITERNYSIGTSYIQRLNDPSPIEKGFPGIWEVWSHRADAYRLRNTSLPTYTIYTQGANYAINAYVMYHLAGDDWGIFQAKEALTNVPAQLNPVKWTQIKTGEIVERRHLQEWTDDDFAIGQQITDGEYDGYFVEEIIVPGGKFPSIEGGNRPTFISGGSAGDVSRNFTGTASDVLLERNHPSNVIGSDNGRGAFRISYINTGTIAYGTSNVVHGGLYFNPSLVVPVGSENSPRAISERLWRRVA
jgi:hypothetical protein